MEYFGAVDDGVAAAQLDADTLPGAVAAQGVEPVVMTGNPEALLTGRTCDQVAGERRSGPVAHEEDCSLVVTTLSDALRDALTTADPEALRRAAVAWGRPEEFWGRYEGDELLPVVEEFTVLTSDARSGDRRLYCRVAL